MPSLRQSRASAVVGTLVMPGSAGYRVLRRRHLGLVGDQRRQDQRRPAPYRLRPRLRWTRSRRPPASRSTGRTSTGTACRRRSRPAPPPRPTSPTPPTSTGRGSASSASSTGSIPMETYVDTKSLTADMPQLASFTIGGHVIGIPLRRVLPGHHREQEDVREGGRDQDARRRSTSTRRTSSRSRTKGDVQYPLNIPFAAAEGLSTYWYQTTGGVRRHGPRRDRASPSSATRRLGRVTRRRSGWSTRSSRVSCRRATSTSATVRASRR